MIDEIDIKIISDLQKDGRIPFTKISDKIDRSTVTVWKRVENLVKDETIKIQANINLSKFYPLIALLDTEAKDFTVIRDTIEHFKDCPRTLLMFQSAGVHIVSIIAAENMPTLESILGACSFRISDGIRRSDVKIGNIQNPSLFMPLRVTDHGGNDVSPCGCNCSECDKYKTECLGCPATKHYLFELIEESK